MTLPVFDPLKQSAQRNGVWTNTQLTELAGKDGCARKAWLAYEQQLPTAPSWHGAVGNAFHDAVEAQLARMQAGEDLLDAEAMAAVAQETLDRMMPHVKHWPWVSDYDSKGKLRATPELAARTVGWLASNWLTVGIKDGLYAGRTLPQRLAGLEIVAVERRLDVKIPGLARPLSGTIDVVAVDRRMGRTYIIDHKTAGYGSSFNSWKHVGEAHPLADYSDDMSMGMAQAKRHQATHYFTLVTKAVEQGLLEGVPETISAEFHVVCKRAPSGQRRKNVLCESMAIGAQDREALRRRLAAAEAVEAEGLWLPNPASRWCEGCPFRVPCQTGSQVLARPVEVAGEFVADFRPAA